MLDHTSEGLHSGAAAIYLDYGADASDCDESDFKICERGMCFKSRWQFTLGTQLAIVLSYPGSDCHERIDAEATVVACDSAGSGCYRVTALFIDLPATKSATLREMRLNLEKRPQLAGAGRS